MIEIDDRFVVMGDWDNSPEPAGKHVIRMAPTNIVFGEGSHYSTQAMVRNLPDDLRGKTVLDIGSGSGILTVAASMLGAKVYAYETSPQAVVCTTSSIALNHVPDAAIEAVTRRGPDRYPPADLVLMNLGDGKEVSRLLPEIFAVLKPGGRVVATVDTETLTLERTAVTVIEDFQRDQTVLVGLEPA